MKKRCLALPLLGLILVLQPLLGCKSSSGLAPGAKAPDFVVSRVDGAARKLSGYRGKAVVLNMWATWCMPCVEEMPVLNAIQREFGARGLEVLGLAGDDDPQRVRDFMVDHDLEFEVLLDPDGSVGTMYEITGYPETFFIDREGRIRWKFIGRLPSDGGRPSVEVRTRIEALMGG